MDKILLSKVDAADVLSISERKLWQMTAPRGPFTAVRLGGRILYSVAEIRRAIADLADRQRDVSSDEDGDDSGQEPDFVRSDLADGPIGKLLKRRKPR